jgi:UDPglucose 6-dehydrogenase
VNKSTVPVGTAAKVQDTIAQQLDQREFSSTAPRPGFSVVSNPAFMKEGAAVEDFMRPDRVVIGAERSEAGARALELLHKLYAPFNRHHERTLVMDVKSAELTKYAANAMLATRISFMNEMANLADRVGADIELVRKGIGSDPRIAYGFLYAGTGYGGSCLPKDVRALSRTAQEQGIELKVLRAVEAVNNDQKHVLVGKIVARFGENLAGHTFAIWGLAFKPNTDDMREAPSRVLIAALVRRGASVRLYDPVAMNAARLCIVGDLVDQPGALSRVSYAQAQMDALQDADALVIATEWKAFRSPDFAAIKAALKQPVIVDGRNLFEPAAMEEAGIEYLAVGRPGLKRVGE